VIENQLPAQKMRLGAEPITRQKSSSEYLGVRFLSRWLSGVEFTRAKLVYQWGFLPNNDFAATPPRYFRDRIALLSPLIVFGSISGGDHFPANLGSRGQP
jgi:hypothetical protein